MSCTFDTSLFGRTVHTPSISMVRRSMHGSGPPLHDFCIPVNGYFPTPALWSELRERFADALKYYPATNEAICEELAELLGLPAASLVLGNGSTELISVINRQLGVHSIATPIPTFSRWTQEPEQLGRDVHWFPTSASESFELDAQAFVRYVRRNGARMAVVCNPNNPTGALLSRAVVLELLDALGDLDLVVIDESFIDFASEGEVPTVAADVLDRPNALVLKSLGKNFGLHGVRLGYAVASPPLAAKLHAGLPQWNINGMGELLIFSLRRHWADYERGRQRTVRDRVEFAERLAAIDGLEVFPSHANFVFVRVPDDVNGTRLRDELLVEHGCLVRECGNKLGSSSSYFRLAVRPRDEADLLLSAWPAACRAINASNSLQRAR